MWLVLYNEGGITGIITYLHVEVQYKMYTGCLVKDSHEIIKMQNLHGIFENDPMEVKPGAVMPCEGLVECTNYETDSDYPLRIHVKVQYVHETDNPRKINASFYMDGFDIDASKINIVYEDGTIESEPKPSLNKDLHYLLVE
jgi:hypothetical protein